MKPTVGRVVWYRPQPNQGLIVHPANGAEPLCALIAGVVDEDASIVNLVVFDYKGNYSNVTNVKLHEFDPDSDARPPRPYAEWMPYQIGQAKKTEQLEEVKRGPGRPRNPVLDMVGKD